MPDPAAPQSAIPRPRGLFARLKGFRRDERGANAVEFGLIALPFFTILLAIIEAAMVFLVGQVLETAVRDAARLIRTGQAQTSGLDAAGFRTEVCNRVYALINCSTGLQVDVRTYANFGSTSFAIPQQSGNFDPNQMQFAMGQGGTIVVARAFYAWPSFANVLGSFLSNQANGSVLLVATSTFRNEPFTP